MSASETVLAGEVDEGPEPGGQSRGRVHQLAQQFCPSRQDQRQVVAQFSCTAMSQARFPGRTGSVLRGWRSCAIAQQRQERARRRRVPVVRAPYRADGAFDAGRHREDRNPWRSRVADN